MIIDTHIHLNDARYDEDLSDVYARAASSGVGGFIIPGADPKDITKAVQISNERANTFFAVGVHPDNASDFDATRDFLHARDEKCVAIGECGLDYFRLPSGAEAQKRAQKEIFSAQIELAKSLDLPLIIHSRAANEDTHAMLASARAHGVFHCFNASPLLLELADDFYFGIGGVLTFKNAKELPAILPKIPLERIVIETDGPYLSPEPFRGQRNEPARTKIVAQKIAEILGLDLEKVEEITTANALRCFPRVKIS